MDEDGSKIKPPVGAADDNTQPDEPLYVISVAAKLVHMPTWTLRVLDEQKIVVPQRTDKKRRLYSDRDLAKLARVRTLTEDEGVNINGVRLILQIEEQRDKGAES